MAKPIQQSPSPPLSLKLSALKTNNNIDNSDDRNNPPPPSFVYHEVVRKRSERQQLNCYDCPQCRKFYEALRRTGHDAENFAVLPRRNSSTSMNHTTSTTICRGHATSTTDTTRTSHHGFGRHRARYAPTNTPTDFWELDFIDER
jgi:hypothetical protein